MPGLARPYRTWGYPFIPAIFVILSVMVLINQWWDSVWVLALVGSGVPAYFLWRIWTRARTV
jgi:APA family basic amino acid/polyamine antiporter